MHLKSQACTRFYGSPKKAVDFPTRSFYPNHPTLSLPQVVMTPHYDSDVPVQYGSWAEYDIMRPWSSEEKNATALAAIFLSNCRANSFRKEVRV